MRPLPLLSLLLLLLPLSTNAAVIKAAKPSHIDHVHLHDNKSSVAYKSSSSTSSLATIRNAYMNLSIQAPSNWKAIQDEKSIFLTLHRDSVQNALQSTIGVGRMPIQKERTPAQLFKKFMKDVTLNEPVNSIAIDWYTPSFQLTSSGTTKVLGVDALSVTYTGEAASTIYVVHRIIFPTDKWLYTIGSISLPQYENEDVLVYTKVVENVRVTVKDGAGGSVGSGKRVRK